MINISVLITTLNEADNLPRCLSALQDFDEIIIIDSGSTDETVAIAKSFGAQVIDFKWDKKYPKKRQWCLDNLTIKHDFVFWVDGDEELTPALVEELRSLDQRAAGYFVKGLYVWDGKDLKHGLNNNKLALINRHKIEFPIVNDLDIEGMGEIEGHYQPVLKEGYKNELIGQLSQSLHHFAYEDAQGWERRHKRYARWEAEMIKRQAYPKDPNIWRERLKTVFRNMPFRGLIAFGHCYIWKAGFLDGAAGYKFALSRLRYYQLVRQALKGVTKTISKN